MHNNKTEPHTSYTPFTLACSCAHTLPFSSSGSFALSMGTCFHFEPRTSAQWRCLRDESQNTKIEIVEHIQLSACTYLFRAMATVRLGSEQATWWHQTFAAFVGVYQRCRCECGEMSRTGNQCWLARRARA